MKLVPFPNEQTKYTVLIVIILFQKRKQVKKTEIIFQHTQQVKKTEIILKFTGYDLPPHFPGKVRQ